jgi:hypothetical protein
MYSMTSYNSIGGIFKDLHFTGKSSLVSKNSVCPKDKYYSRGYKLTGEYSKSKSIVVFISGSYTDSHGKNKKEIKLVGFLDVPSNNFNLVATPYDEEVINFLKAKHILPDSF